MRVKEFFAQFLFLSLPLCLYAQVGYISSAPDGSYTILDPKEPSIQTFDDLGKSLYRFGGWSLQSENAFDQVVHIFSQSGLKHYVSDFGQSAVFVFDKRLQLIAKIDTYPLKPIASMLLGGERLLVIDQSYQYWYIINSRSGDRVLIELDPSVEVDREHPILLGNAQVFIPIKTDSEFAKKTIQYAAFSENGEYICSHFFKGPIRLFSSFQQKLYVLDDLKLKEVDCKVFETKHVATIDSGKTEALYYLNANQLIEVNWEGKRKTAVRIDIQK